MQLKRVTHKFIRIDQIIDHAIRQIWIDSSRTKTKKNRKMMGVTRLCSINNDVRRTTQAFFDETVMHGTCRHRCRHNPLVFGHVTIRENQQSLSRAHRVDRLLAYRFYSGFKPTRRIKSKLDLSAAILRMLNRLQQINFRRRKYW